MSEENVEIALQQIDAFNGPDLDALVALLSRDVVWEENPELPGLREVYRGPAEVREWGEQILEVVESPHSELVEITELSGDRVFTETFVTGRGKGSGVPVELRYWSVLWFAEGKIARRQVFWSKGRALEAAGLSE
jgi:ketosteroid isomerase-like protein